MNLQIEISEGMSQIIAGKVRSGEFESPESFAMTAIARYLDEQAEIAHTGALIAEAEASGPYLELNDAEWDRIMAEALAGGPH